LKHVLSKRGKELQGVVELKAKSDMLLLQIKCLGTNPYKVVKMWKTGRWCRWNTKYQCDTLYAEPEAEVMAKVKDEKVYQAETRVGLKGIKYGTAKNTIEDMAFGDGGVS
jgi:hypothetical protein